MIKLTDLFFTIALSSCTGALVGLPVILMGDWDIFPNLMKSAFVGMITGITVRVAFTFFYRNLKNSSILPFVIFFIIIAGGTCGGACILGLRNVLYHLIITGLAELTGMLMAITGYNYYIKLNKSLEKTQKRFK